MNDAFSNKEYRDAFVEANIRNGIAFQIRALRKRQGLSQRDLGEKMGKQQNVISRLEDPDYGKLTLQTLLTLARTFDVGLIVRFVSYGQLIASLGDVSDERLAVPNFEEEAAERFAGEVSDLIEEFSASRFSNQLRSSVTSAPSQSPTPTSKASNVIDACAMFARSQSSVSNALSANARVTSGALTAITSASQEQRARAL